MSGRASELRPFRLAALMLAAALAGAMGGWPTWRWLGRAGLEAMAAGGAAALVGSLVGLVVVASRAGQGPQTLAIGFLLAAPVRLAVTLGLCGAVWAWGPWPAEPLFLWTAGFHVLFLGAEVCWLSGVFRRGPSRNG